MKLAVRSLVAILAIVGCAQLVSGYSVKAEENIILEFEPHYQREYNRVIQRGWWAVFTSTMDGRVFIRDVVVNRGNCPGSLWEDMVAMHTSPQIPLLRKSVARLRGERTLKYGQTARIGIGNCKVLEVKAVTDRGTFTWNVR